MRLDLSRLINVKRQPDGSIQCQCPACAVEGNDKTGKNHLRVYGSGAFNCILHGQDKIHNRAIRAYLVNTALDDNPDIVYIDPEPTIKVDKVYPEDTLSKLMPIYDYWIDRGAKPEVLRKLEGGLAPEDEKSKLSNRFIFPIRGSDNRIYGFTGRLTQDNSFAPSWKHLGKKGSFIFPARRLSEPHIRANSQVILVESVGCVLALAGAGIWNTICLFGLNLSSKQLAYLLSLGVKQIVIATNNEESGIGNRAADRLQDRLSAFFTPENLIIHLPYDKDFMEMSQERLVEWCHSLPKPCIREHA